MQIIKNTDHNALKKIRIADLGKIVTGNTPSKQNDSNFSNSPTPYPWYTVKDMGNTDICKPSSYLSEQGSQKARKIPPKSVLCACIGSIGKVAYNNKMLFINQQINAIIPNDNHCNKYIYYIFKAYPDLIKKHSERNVVPIINKNNFSNILVPVHEKHEQEKIASFLSERESYLESIETLISKMEQRNQYYLQKLTSGHSTIEENNFVNNHEDFHQVEIDRKNKQIPLSFKVFRLNEILKEEKKSKIAVRDAVEGDYPFFNCSESLTMSHNQYLIDGDYIILSTGGKPSLHYHKGKMAYSSDSYVVSSFNDEVDTRYLSYLLKANIDRINRCFLGSGLKHLNKKIFKKELYYFPALKKQQEIADFMSMNEKELDLVKKLYSKEKQVFQWLCEKLVSGEYKIED